MPNFKLGGEVQSLRELHFPAALGALVLLRRRQFPSSVLWAGYTEADCLFSSNQLWLAVPRGPDMQQLQKSNRLRNNPGVSLLRLPLRSSSSSMIRQPQKRTDAPSQAPTVAPSVLPTCSPSSAVTTFPPERFFNRHGKCCWCCWSRLYLRYGGGGRRRAVSTGLRRSLQDKILKDLSSKQHLDN